MEGLGERGRWQRGRGEVAKLHFVVEGDDRAQSNEAESEVRAQAKYLPEQYDVGVLLAATKDPTRLGGELVQIYLGRCYNPDRQGQLQSAGS